MSSQSTFKYLVVEATTACQIIISEGEAQLKKVGFTELVCTYVCMWFYVPYLSE